MMIIMMILTETLKMSVNHAFLSHYFITFHTQKIENPIH